MRLLRLSALWRKFVGLESLLICQSRTSQKSAALDDRCFEWVQLSAERERMEIDAGYRKCQNESPTRMWCIRLSGNVYATVIPKIAWTIPNG